jgi:ABC-2 type transport system permease protein
MRKDLRVLKRDRTALIFTFALPLFFTLIFGSAFGRSGSDGGKNSPMKLLVANMDAGPHGSEVVAAMKQVGLTVEPAASGAEATARVKKGDMALGVVIAPDFSVQLEQAVKQAVAGDPNHVQARLQVLVDPAQMQIAGFVQGALFAAVQRASAPLYRAASLERVPAEFRDYAAKTMSPGNGQPAVALDVERTTKDKVGPTAGDQLMPGFTIYFVFFLANGVAVTLIMERQEGTLRRMLSAPIARGHILFGKLLARSWLGFLQVLMLYVVGYYTLHYSIGVNPLGQALIALVCIGTAAGLGLLIATLGRTQEQIQGMTTLAFLLMGFISGCLIPRAFLPDALQKLSLITPHAWALNAYQDILLRRQPLTAALPDIGVVALFGVVFYSIALARFKYE